MALAWMTVTAHKRPNLLTPMSTRYDPETRTDCNASETINTKQVRSAVQTEKDGKQPHHAWKANGRLVCGRKHTDRARHANWTTAARTLCALFIGKDHA